MKDHGLDLPSSATVLVDPCSRLVWRCYPRFDGDPSFLPIIVGQEGEGISYFLLFENLRGVPLFTNIPFPPSIAVWLVAHHSDG